MSCRKASNSPRSRRPLEREGAVPPVFRRDCRSLRSEAAIDDAPARSERGRHQPAHVTAARRADKTGTPGIMTPAVMVPTVMMMATVVMPALASGRCGGRQRRRAKRRSRDRGECDFAKHHVLSSRLGRRRRRGERSSAWFDVSPDGQVQCDEATSWFRTAL